MSLTEFLLARIWDDAAVARQLEVDLGRWDREEAPNGAADSQGNIVAATLRGGAFSPARILADCEAKERIVEAARKETTLGNRDADDGWDIAWACALTFLALPYADHPDYDESWRP